MDKSTFIIMGATGDLATRRLIPALYEMIVHQKLESCLIIGVALDAVPACEILERCKKYIPSLDERAWQLLQERFFYERVDFKKVQDFDRLADRITSLEKNFSCPHNRTVYMAISPQFFCSVTRELSRVGIIKRMDGKKELWYRVAYEKPFGADEESAIALNRCLAQYLDESQIFRIDHYLAKDIIDNIAVLRFANSVFEPQWNHSSIDWVEIILNESLTIGARGSYFDSYGQIRDVMQNHMLQILALIAMEEPTYLSGEYIRDQKAKVLQALQPKDLLLGQYEGYRSEPGVKADSSTETFALLKLMIDMPRWQGVPFYLKTGKALKERETLIHIQFKPTKCILTESCPTEANYLTIRVIPNAGFSLHLNVKKPGMRMNIKPVSMDFSYEQAFGRIPENSYEVLLRELLRGEPSISVRFDEVEYAWQCIDKARALSSTLYTYAIGSDGPDEVVKFEMKHDVTFKDIV